MTARLAGTLALAAALTLGACTTSKEDPSVTPTTIRPAGSPGATPTTQAESTARLKAAVEPIIAAVGPVKEVRKDEVVACGSGDTGGYAATYTVWVTPTAGAQQRVQDTLAPQLQAAGWQVELNPRTDEVDWSFHKDGFDLITFFHPAQGIAVVGGSGPCLPDKA